LSLKSSDSERVVLVDEQDNPVGQLDKLEAHRRGLRHRAVSVFLRDGNGKMLLQRRASEKYHSGGLWANACCGHPRPDERIVDAATRRLGDEMGVRCELRPLFTTLYCASVSNELIEHEFVHAFGGHFEGTPSPNPHEVQEWRWLSIDEIEADIVANPEQFAVWFRIYVSQFLAHIAKL
jgi:isopentenyl-diphosphate Delta-isomerase